VLKCTFFEHDVAQGPVDVYLFWWTWIIQKSEVYLWKWVWESHWLFELENLNLGAVHIPRVKRKIGMFPKRKKKDAATKKDFVYFQIEPRRASSGSRKKNPAFFAYFSTVLRHIATMAKRWCETRTCKEISPHMRSSTKMTWKDHPLQSTSPKSTIQIVLIYPTPRYIYKHRVVPTRWVELTITVELIIPIKVGLGVSWTNAESQWNPVCRAFHRIRCCGNETIRR